MRLSRARHSGEGEATAGRLWAEATTITVGGSSQSTTGREATGREATAHARGVQTADPTARRPMGIIILKPRTVGRLRTGSPRLLGFLVSGRVFRRPHHRLMFTEATGTATLKARATGKVTVASTGHHHPLREGITRPEGNSITRLQARTDGTTGRMGAIGVEITEDIDKSGGLTIDAVYVPGLCWFFVSCIWCRMCIALVQTLGTGLNTGLNREEVVAYPLVCIVPYIGSVHCITGKRDTSSSRDLWDFYPDTVARVALFVLVHCMTEERVSGVSGQLALELSSFPFLCFRWLFPSHLVFFFSFSFSFLCL